MTLQDLHDRLLAWATADARQGELLRARKEHFALFGEPHEDERSFEARVNGMLDAYLYDYRPGGGADSTLEAFLAAEGGAFSSEDLARLRALAGSVHCLFEIRKIRPGEWVRLRDVFTRDEYEVAERRQLAGLEKDDLLEARLLPHDGKLYFSGAFLFHPREVRKQILVEVKRRRKAAPRGTAPDARDFLARLSRMAQKLERYRNVKVESLYDFSAPAPTPPPFRR
jgi:hypothetical protein